MALLLRGKIYIGYCPVCGNSTLFYEVSNYLRETCKCIICGSIARHRHLAMVLCNLLGMKKLYSLKRLKTVCPNLKIYEAGSSGPIHDSLKNLGGYICSEFFTHVLSGTSSENGVRCEDLQELSFENASFDIVITQDVFEHIRDPELAWKEIFRVLKPSGYHIFTIPYSKDHVTVRRVELEEEKDTFILPKVFHGDDIRDGFVYTDFGYDLIDYLDRIGFSTQVFWSSDSDLDMYRIAGSSVFVSKKSIAIWP